MSLPEVQDTEVPARLDISCEVCPMTYVRTKLALDRLEPGALLEVALRGPDAAKNVPRSAGEEGHQIVSLTEQPGGLYRLLLRKGKESPRWR